MGFIRAAINGVKIARAGKRYLEESSSNVEKTNTDVVNNITMTEWDLTDNFEISISGNANSEASYFEKILTKGFKMSSVKFSEIVNKSIISVEVPVMSSQEIDNVVAGTRKLGTRLYERFTIVLRFRDSDNSFLRKVFTTLWVAGQYEFPENIYLSVSVYNKKLNNKNLLFKSEKFVITQVSSITLDNTNTAINEFTINLVSGSFSDGLVKDFGVDNDYVLQFDPEEKSGNNQTQNLVGKVKDKIKDRVVGGFTREYENWIPN